MVAWRGCIEKEALTMSGRVPSFVIACMLVGAARLMAGAALSQVPEKINYQLRITDSTTGEPEPGAHELVFRIFELETGGTAAWDETHNIVADETGVVSIILGNTAPLDIDFDGPVWLEVQVDGEVLEPRREIVSVPYAFRAMESDNADSLGGVYSGDYVVEGETGVVTGDMIVETYADSAHNHDDRYYTQDELDTAGSINDTGNPVDWTKLKSVPTGFADGTDDAGEGDGHSLDAADGSPVDALK